MFKQKAQPDFYKFMLDLPMARDPGGDLMFYCSGGINLLGEIIRNAAGLSFEDFFETRLAQPLQMSNYHLNLTLRVKCTGVAVCTCVLGMR